jgi:hypothetical protein
MDIRLLLHPNNPGFWILTSLIGWVAIRLTTRYWSSRQLRWINVARWVLIPYAGLMAGSLSPQLMGLTGINWQATLGVGIVLTAILIGMMAIVRFTLVDPDDSADAHSSDAVVSDRHEDAAPEAGWLSGGIRPLQTIDSPNIDTSAAALRPSNRDSFSWNGLTVILSGAEQFQWSFLRGAVWEIALLSGADTNPTGYWAIWIATLLALPAVLLQPLNRADKLLKVSILIISAMLFVFTRNFWLCWIFHASAWLLLASSRSSTDEVAAL